MSRRHVADRARAGDGGHLEERQRRHRARRAWPTPRRSSPASPRVSAATPTTCSSPPPASSAASTPWSASAPASPRSRPPLPGTDAARRRPRHHDHRHRAEGRPSATSPGRRRRVVGVAKGVGMIEPDMATMITLLFTDAELDARPSSTPIVPPRRSTARSTACRSTPTRPPATPPSCSPAARPGRVDTDRVRGRAVRGVRSSLTKQIARDGEGADDAHRGARRPGASTPAQAKRVAKAIVNSPLVKTAVHGADPNWGRVAMAVGKCTDDDRSRPGAGRHPLRRPGGLPGAGRRRRARGARRPTCVATTCAST